MQTMDRKQAIGLMLASFPASQSQGQLVALGYLMAVEDLSDFAVETAARAYIKGEVPDTDRRFAPSAAKFAEYAKRYNISQQAVEFVARHPEALEKGPHDQRYKDEMMRRVQMLDGAKPVAAEAKPAIEHSAGQRKVMVKKMHEAGIGWLVGDEENDRDVA